MKHKEKQPKLSGSPTAADDSARKIDRPGFDLSGSSDDTHAGTGLGLGEALSRLLVCCAKMHGVAMFHAAAVMASHLSIAAARNCRIVLREIR